MFYRKLFENDPPQLYLERCRLEVLLVMDCTRVPQALVAQFIGNYGVPVE